MLASESRPGEFAASTDRGSLTPPGSWRPTIGVGGLGAQPDQITDKIDAGSVDAISAAIHMQVPMDATHPARAKMSIAQRMPGLTGAARIAGGTSRHGPAMRPAGGIGLAAPQEAGINRWLPALIAVLAVAALAACTQPASPPDTPAAHLDDDLAAMRAFPSPKVTTRCAAALRELSSARQEITDQQQRAKPVDPVSLDVLQSDQEEAEASCHPDAVRLCQAPVDPAAAKACGLVVQ
jgi:hypothetical protein